MKQLLTHETKMAKATKRHRTRHDVQQGTKALLLRAGLLNRDIGRAFLELEYPALDGSRKLARIPRELFRSPNRVADELARIGASMLDAKAEVLAILPPPADLPYYEVTGRTGWLEDSFVYPTRTYGPLAEKLRYEPSQNIDPALGLEKGTCRGWR